MSIRNVGRGVFAIISDPAAPVNLEGTPVAVEMNGLMTACPIGDRGCPGLRQQEGVVFCGLSDHPGETGQVERCHARLSELAASGVEAKG